MTNQTRTIIEAGRNWVIGFHGDDHQPFVECLATGECGYGPHLYERATLSEKVEALQLLMSQMGLSTKVKRGWWL